MNAERLRDRLPVTITALVALILYVAAGLHFPHFFSMRVAVNFFTDNSFLGIIAVGVTFVILTGGIDLSVGSMMGCTSIMAASLITKQHLHPMLGLLIPVAFGLGFGAIQGYLISEFSLPPFLVTLAGLFFCRGLGLWISRESIQIDHPFFSSLAEFAVSLPGKASVMLPTILFVVVVAIGSFVAKQTPFGRAIYAIGGSPASAKLMGLPVKRTLLIAYALSGACAGLGGAVFTIYTSSGNAISGTGLELDAIASVVIGGTLLSGGYGSIFGTLLGVLILGIVQTAITFQGDLSSWWTRIVIGALLLLFMLVQKTIERAAAKRVGASA
jgi:simple sugar transport system permease protein